MEIHRDMERQWDKEVQDSIDTKENKRNESIERVRDKPIEPRSPQLIMMAGMSEDRVVILITEISGVYLC